MSKLHPQIGHSIFLFYVALPIVFADRHEVTCCPLGHRRPGGEVFLADYGPIDTDGRRWTLRPTAFLRRFTLSTEQGR